MAVASPEALAAAFGDAINAGDADALGALFTEDALFVNIAGMPMAGRDGIIDGHRWALAGRRADLLPRAGMQLARAAGRREFDQMTGELTA